MIIKNLLSFMAWMPLMLWGQGGGFTVNVLKQRHFSNRVPPGNYSGICYLGNDKYAVVDDKAPAGGFSILEIKIDSLSGEIMNVELVKNVPGTVRGIDGEGIAYVDELNEILICSEKRNDVCAYKMDGTVRGTVVVLPDSIHKSLQDNRGLESLTWDNQEKKLWMATEREPCRIIKMNSRFAIEKIYLYHLDSVTASTNSENGLSELISLNDSTLLTLEREYYIPKMRIGAWVDTKIYKVVCGEDALRAKELVVRWRTRMTLTNRSFANYEGMCLGPKLSDGALVLVLVADSQNGYKGVLKDWFRTIVIRY